MKKRLVAKSERECKESELECKKLRDFIQYTLDHLVACSAHTRRVKSNLLFWIAISDIVLVAIMAVAFIFLLAKL